MVTRLLLACTTRKPADVGFNNVVKNGKQERKKQNKPSTFARSAISLFDQIMSITRLYIVLVLGQEKIERTSELMYFNARYRGGEGVGGSSATDISRERK